MMNESFPYSIATILILQVWRKQSFSFEKKYQSAWGGFWGHFLQWWSVFLVSKSGLWVSIGPKSLGPWNRFWDFESIWSSQKAHKFRHIQRRTKTRILCFDSQSHTKINYCCFMHVIYSINKAASIYSSINFGYSVIAGSFGGQVSFESTESELKFFTMNLYHTQFSRTFCPLAASWILFAPPSFLAPSASSAIKFFGPPAFWSYSHDRCGHDFKDWACELSYPSLVGKNLFWERVRWAQKCEGHVKSVETAFIFTWYFLKKFSFSEKSQNLNVWYMGAFKSQNLISVGIASALKKYKQGVIWKCHNVYLA